MAWLIAFYCVSYIQSMETKGPAASIYYSVVMFMICFSAFLMFGFVGLFACFYWNLRLYSRVKAEHEANDLADRSEPNVGLRLVEGNTPESLEQMERQEPQDSHEMLIVESQPSQAVTQSQAATQKQSEQNPLAVPLLAA